MVRSESEKGNGRGDPPYAKASTFAEASDYAKASTFAKATVDEPSDKSVDKSADDHLSRFSGRYQAALRPEFHFGNILK